MATQELDIVSGSLSKGLAVSQLYHFALGAQIFTTLKLHELHAGLTSDQILPETIGIYAFSLAGGIILEAESLKRRGYNSNLISTAVNKFIKSPYGSALTGVAFGTLYGILTNPSDFAGVASLFSGDHGKFFLDNLESKAITGLIYESFTGWLILSGKSDEFFEKINKVGMTLFPAETSLVPNPQIRDQYLPNPAGWNRAR